MALNSSENNDSMDSSDSQDYYLIDLILMIASSAQMDLGELSNPFLKTKEINLPRARTSINMLVALAQKTKDNLNSEEQKVLKTTLETLQKLYVTKSKISDSTSSPNHS
jgi:hypothetical protein